MKRFRKYWPYLLADDGSDIPEWRKHLQPCEWIESDRDSAISIDYIAGDDTVIETHIQVTESIVNVAIFGSRMAYRDKMFEFLINSVNHYNYLLNNQVTQGDTGITPGDDFIKFGNGKLSINGIEFSIPDYTSRNKLKLALFSCSEGNSDTFFSPCFVGRMFFYNIYDSGHILKIKLLPVYVIDEYTDNKGIVCGEGVPGMIDTLTGVFYTNDGGGQFSHGGDIEI